MSVRFDIVASAENNHYMAWQAMLFHFSCVSRAGKVPIIVVHKAEHDKLLPAFHQIQNRGGKVQAVRNFKADGGIMYPPRNTAGALSAVKSDADFIMLCDADMIFLRPLELEQFSLTHDQVSFDRVSYMRVNPRIRGQLEPAARRAGIDMQQLEQLPANGGVPHIIPQSLQSRLSAEWLTCIDFFDPPPNAAASKPQLPWVASMWALVFAVLRLRLTPQATEFCVSNFHGNKPIPRRRSESAAMLHYCYRNDGFDKRKFDSPAAFPDVWRQRARDDSVSEVLCSQLREAHGYYEKNQYDLTKIVEVPD